MRHKPLYRIISDLNRLPLPEQIDKLQTMVRLERPFSVRRNELQSVLTGKMTKQLRREMKHAS